jgi:hypothetical protein
MSETTQQPKISAQESTQEDPEKDTIDVNALIVACGQKQPEVVKVLLGIPSIDPTLKDNSALLLSLQYGDKVSADILFEDKRVKSTISNELKCLYHIVKDEEEVAIQLLPKVDVTWNNQLLLRSAIQTKHGKLVSQLLKMEDIDINVLNGMAIVLAIESGDMGVVKVLFKSKKIDTMTTDGLYFKICIKCNHIGLFIFLLGQNNADPSFKNNYLLKLTAGAGRKEMVEALLKYDKVLEKVNE